MSNTWLAHDFNEIWLAKINLSRPPLVAMHRVIHKQGSEYWYASTKCKCHRTQVLFEVVKKCTYLWASTVLPSLLLSPPLSRKVRWQVSSRRDEGNSSRNTVTLHESPPPQWMTAAGVQLAWTLGHQDWPTATCCIPPPPSSPLSPSPQWGWGLRERHKQKGRTVRSCVLNCFMLSSVPCFYAFCWSAIPTSCYIFDIFYSCSCSFC